MPDLVRGVVHLVGAGPGDPGLVTVRGRELLRRCEVVVHDRLVHPGVVALAVHAVRIDVGKRPGDGLDQEVINDILIDEALAGRDVVRLKGGDPFLYGRGGEEAEALRAAGIEFEVVPGVSSAIAAAALAGIPLTHRDHASWVAVATGTARGDDAVDWDAVARAPTIVLLMAVRTLGEIADRLMNAGRSADTPVAVVSWASWPEQSAVHATLGTVAALAAAEGVRAPAVVVAGNVADLGRRLSWWRPGPLAGRRVLVTRPGDRASGIVRRLEALGAEAIRAPAIRTHDVGGTHVRDAISALGIYDWAAFTSATAVGAVRRALDALGADARAFAGVRVAAVGERTARELADGLGLRPDLTADPATSATLARAFASGPGRVAFFCAEVTSGDLEGGLAGKGWTVDRVVCYRTTPDPQGLEAGRRALSEGVDAALFASPSAVRAAAGGWGPLPDGVLVCCIGPRTAVAAEEAGMRVDVVSPSAGDEALVSALVEAVGG